MSEISDEIRVSNVSLELLPRDGSCVQKCPHCTHGASHKDDSVAYGFTQETLGNMTLIQEYLAGKRERLSRINIVGDMSVATDLTNNFPTNPVPDRIHLILGEFPNLQSQSPQEIIRLSRNCMSIVAALYPLAQEDINTPSLTFGFKAKNDIENGLNESEVGTYIAFFSLLLNMVISDSRVFRDFHIRIDQNAIRKSGGDFLKNTFEQIRFLGILSVIMEQVCASASEVIGKLKTRTYHTMLNDVDHYVISEGTGEFPSGFNFGIASRMIHARNAPGTQLTPLPMDRLLIALMPEGAWIEHSTRNVKDSTVRMTHAELEDIIRNCIKHELDLKTEVHASVNKKRKMHLSIV